MASFSVIFFGNRFQIVPYARREFSLLLRVFRVLATV
jgi:hypothetical protein